MRVFLTGADGQVGSPDVHNLPAAGHSAFGLMRVIVGGEALAMAGGRPVVDEAPALRRTTLKTARTSKG